MHNFNFSSWNKSGPNYHCNKCPTEHKPRCILFSVLNLHISY